MKATKCNACGCFDSNLFDVNGETVCDLCLMDKLDIKDPTDNKPKVTKCPPMVAEGYGDMQPSYVSTGGTKRKPNLDEIDRFLNNFIPEVL